MHSEFEITCDKDGDDDDDDFDDDDDDSGVVHASFCYNQGRSYVGIVQKLIETFNPTLTSTSRSTLLVEPPDEVVPQPEE